MNLKPFKRSFRLRNRGRSDYEMLIDICLSAKNRVKAVHDAMENETSADQGDEADNEHDDDQENLIIRTFFRHGRFALFKQYALYLT